MRICHGGNSDDLVSIPAMTGTVAVNFCAYFNGLYKQKEEKKVFLIKEVLHICFLEFGSSDFIIYTLNAFLHDSKVSIIPLILDCILKPMMSPTLIASSPA